MFVKCFYTQDPLGSYNSSLRGFLQMGRQGLCLPHTGQLVALERGPGLGLQPVRLQEILSVLYDSPVLVGGHLLGDHAVAGGSGADVRACWLVDRLLHRPPFGLIPSDVVTWYFFPCLVGRLIVN